MSRLSAIEKWYYGLVSLEGDDAPESRFTRRLRTEASVLEHWTTVTTTTASLDRTMSRAMGVKMVADELLAATGTVIGATFGLLASPGSPYLGAKSGEAAGRAIGSMMWSVIS